jgi:hypothetical protein
VSEHAATLKWDGRKLKCNGVAVAIVLDIDRQRWFYRLGTSLYLSREFAKEQTARRHVERRFGIGDIS